MISILNSGTDHFSLIDEVVRSAFLAQFGSEDEVRLVRHLRRDGDVVLEKIACHQNWIVGHIMFSRLKTSGTGGLVALAPVSVRPDVQGQGIGTQLIRTSLSELEASGEGGAVVLGNPTYYSRFGFLAERAQRLVAPFSGTSLMALEWKPGSIEDGARITYAPAFRINPQV